jgi:hypothetical protein
MSSHPTKENITKRSSFQSIGDPHTWVNYTKTIDRHAVALFFLFIKINLFFFAFFRRPTFRAFEQRARARQLFECAPIEKEAASTQLMSLSVRFTVIQHISNDEK